MTDVIRTVLVDDEKLARDRLRGFLQNEPGLSIVGEAADGEEAVRVIREHQPDLVFLDVQMPGMNGFEVLKTLNGDTPWVVFATAYDEYAIRAFEVQALDYLLKPFGRARLRMTLERVRERLAAGQSSVDLEALLRELNDRRKPSVAQVSVHNGKRILLLSVEDILWFGVEYRLVYAHTTERGFMTNHTLRELEERLDPDVFFRAHKATLVNLRHVKELIPWFGGRMKLVMSDAAATQIEVSRAQARVLRAQLGM